MSGMVCKTKRDGGSRQGSRRLVAASKLQKTTRFEAGVLKYHHFSIFFVAKNHGSSRQLLQEALILYLNLFDAISNI
jgi:hypothetical protein